MRRYSFFSVLLTCALGLGCTSTHAQVQAAGAITAANAAGSTKATVMISVGPKHPALLKGSFFQIYDVSSRVAADWGTEFATMKAAKISDHVIWQWTALADPSTGTYQTYYPTGMPGFTKLAGLASTDPVGDSLAQAAAAGMQVWLGLCWSDDWWTYYANDQAWLDQQTAYNTQTAAELWSRYGAKYGNTIAGFYLPMEVDNDNFSTAAQQTAITGSFKTICDFVHTHCDDKPVMNAPFCSDTASMDRTAWKGLWTCILGSAALDVIAMQDGCGASDDGGITTHTTTVTAPQWFDAIKAAIDAVRPATQLWSDLETYRMYDLDGDSNPATEAQIEAQIAAEKDHVRKFTTYSTMEYQDPYTGHASQYQAYKAYALKQAQP